MKYLVYLTLSLFLLSCGNKKKEAESESAPKIETKKVDVNGKYTIEVADFLNSASGLNDDASLQYQNPVREVYIIVIDEPKKEFEEAIVGTEFHDSTKSTLSNYANAQAESIKQNVTISKISNMMSRKIGSLNAESISVEGSVSGVPFPIFYHLTYVEGKEDLYMIMQWGLQSKRDEINPIFEKTVNSFKEL